MPELILAFVRAIYLSRHFHFKDGGHTSLEHPYKFGICHECPPSPFLFSMLMTVLMHDAKSRLAARAVTLDSDVVAHDILYADNTVGVSFENVERHMECIAEVGSGYGLSSNLSRLETMPVRCVAAIHKFDGTFVKSVESMVYLGSLMCGDRTIGPEFCQRIGAATAEFWALSRIWSHASISKQRHP